MSKRLVEKKNDIYIWMRSHEALGRVCGQGGVSTLLLFIHFGYLGVWATSIEAAVGPDWDPRAPIGTFCDHRLAVEDHGKAPLQLLAPLPENAEQADDEVRAFHVPSPPPWRTRPAGPG